MEKKTLPYIDMVAISFDGLEPFDQIVLSTESHKWILMKIVKEVSEKKTFKDFTILYMYISQGQGQITAKI